MSLRKKASKAKKKVAVEMKKFDISVCFIREAKSLKAFFEFGKLIRGVCQLKGDEPPVLAHRGK